MIDLTKYDSLLFNRSACVYRSEPNSILCIESEAIIRHFFYAVATLQWYGRYILLVYV